MQQLGSEQLEAATGGNVDLIEALLRDIGADETADWWKDVHTPAKNSHPDAK